MGWSGLTNGVLLDKARAQFDAFLTVDQNVQFQQNLSVLPLPVAIIVAADNRFVTLAPYAAAVMDWLGQPLICELVRIENATQIVRVAARRADA